MRASGYDLQRSRSSYVAQREREVIYVSLPQKHVYLSVLKIPCIECRLLIRILLRLRHHCVRMDILSLRSSSYNNTQMQSLDYDVCMHDGMVDSLTRFVQNVRAFCPPKQFHFCRVGQGHKRKHNMVSPDHTSTLVAAISNRIRRRDTCTHTYLSTSASSTFFLRSN